MRRYKTHLSQSYGSHRRMTRRLLIIGVVLLILFIVGGFMVHRSYNSDLNPVSNSQATIFIPVASGTPPDDIAELLYDKGLIRSADSFMLYITSHNLRNKLQAGTYKLSPSMSTPEIVNKLVKGDVATDLVTILPGQTISEIRKAFIVAGFKVTDVDAALQPGLYSNHPALADNPAGTGLEGFLYPDSYQKDANTNPKTVIKSSLDEMQKHLTTKIRAGFAKQGLTVYQGVTIASMVETEVSGQTDRDQVAQVFLTRLHNGMTLGSDTTLNFANSINDPRYNTRKVKGLPPGPIASVTDSSLMAVAYPADTDWLYFVSGDPNPDGVSKTYFSHTLDEHEANTERYCHILCQ